MIESQLPKFCPGCDSKKPDWTETTKDIVQIYKDEAVTVNSEVSQSRCCGFELLTDDQMDKLYKKVCMTLRT